MNNHVEPSNQLKIDKMHVFLKMTWYNMHMEICIFLLQSLLDEALNIYPYEQDQIRSLCYLLSFFSKFINVPMMLSQTFFSICNTSKL